VTKKKPDAKYRNYTEQDLREAIDTSSSIREVLVKLGLIPAGGNYMTIKRRARELGLDLGQVLHAGGQGWRKGRTFGPKRPLSYYLVNGSKISSSNLRLRLTREGILECKCSRCGITKWQGYPAPLELDHINGDSEDNRLENLRILCPNCHALTPTYRRRKS